jgi:hypothetical protein
MHAINATQCKQAVKHHGSAAFKHRIRLPINAHTINNITAIAARINHSFNSVNIILQIRINGQHRITGNGHHSRQHSVLVPTVAGQLDACNPRIVF